ncbi:MAG: HypC/HybG/HupF family hydrogenase formation chaperone [Archaeoglobaceae archaeon]|nr:HypC/HybG/HupF family hydrogenase formation chaperone [Archaeoglobaceae archaeon]MDW7990222.1 HypC/HybG/HupF family hydrogenase formation chaperone [Archaeoglobaceae archaeon]
MCLGTYGRVVKIQEYKCWIDFGGVIEEAISVVEDLSIGDYVIVHAGVVISKLSKEEFLDSFKYLYEIKRKLVEEGEQSKEELKKLESIFKLLID